MKTVHLGYSSCCSKLEFLTLVVKMIVASRLYKDSMLLQESMPLHSHWFLIPAESGLSIVVHATCVLASIVTLHLKTLVVQIQISKCVRCRLCRI